MRYCKKCDSRLDDLDGYCSHCGARVEYDGQDSNQGGNDECNKNSTAENTINNITDIVSKNADSFVCFLCGILSLTAGTFICAIVSLVFGKFAVEKGQTKDSRCATFCKVGRICSKISIALTVIALIVLIVCLIVLPIVL